MLSEGLLVVCRLFDLKSHNVLLTRDGTGKIADVGLAKVLTQVGSASCLGATMRPACRPLARMQGRICC